MGGEFEWIEKVIVNPPQNNMYRLQAFEGFKKDLPIANGQIRALKQGEAQVFTEIGMFKIRFIERAGREQHNIWTIRLAGSHPPQCVALRAEKCGKSLDLALPKFYWKDSRDDHSVFQRVAATGRRLAAITEDPPLPVRRTGQVCRRQMQVDIVGNRQPVAWPQKAGVCVNEGRRYQSLA